MHNPKATHTSLGVVSLFVLSFLVGCAADLSAPITTTKTNTAITEQGSRAAALIGTRLNFNYSDFYTLTSPNPSTNCAGDANSFYDPINLDSTTSTPSKLETNLLDSTTTIRPSFIKNVSVDLTDSNASSAANKASACSLGNGPTTPPTSSCATFDYGAIGGVPSGLGGTLLLIGGIQSINYSGLQSNFLPSHSLTVNCGPVLSPSVLTAPIGYSACATAVYSLGIGTLPASAAGTSLAPGLKTSTSPISMWANLSNVTNYAGPRGTAGAVATFNSAVQKVLLFGGSTPFSTSTSLGPGSTTYDTWVYDIKTQKWTLTNAGSTVAIDLLRTYDFDSSTSTKKQISKVDGGRALFGYAAVAGMGISKFTLDGLAAPVIDTTDRIIIMGGMGNNCNGKTCTDTHSFNPTYGPEYRDSLAQSAASQMQNDFSSTPLVTKQWIDSYHTQVLSNGQTETTHIPSGFPTPSPTPTSTSEPMTSISFGMVGLNNNRPLSTGQGVSQVDPHPLTAGITSLPGAGYLVTAGGFFGYPAALGSYPGKFNIPDSSTCTSLDRCGGMQIFLNWFTTASYSQVNERYTTNFSHNTNWTDRESDGVTIKGSRDTPGRWTTIPKSAKDAIDTTPWFGAGVMLKGINVSSAAQTPAYDVDADPANQTAAIRNEVVFFGGSDCREYLTDSTACPLWPTTSTNTGRYWVFGKDPAKYLNPSVAAPGNYPRQLAYGGISAPTNAGMAGARGADPSGNPIIVAWGGMTRAATVDTSGTIYYLYNNTGVPTWASYIVPAGGGPSGLANSAMVYSHVTGKFYLFGGYSPSTSTRGETWELSISSAGTSATCGVQTSATCIFTWKLLDSTAGLTCYPNCPPVRRSHRMVEANYNYFNAPLEPDCSSASLPCSFGIFMQGGSPDGTTIHSDRWMFDPTANGGGGHWQLMGEMPPRTLSAAADLSYTIAGTGAPARRVLLFGGETGLQNPIKAQGLGSSFFVPPTLGDTWMFDFDTNSWNRVFLLGERFQNDAAPSMSGNNQLRFRSASFVSDTSTQLLSPPPLSGAIMVTRTHSKMNHSTLDTANPLTIPEVFLFGGRTKEGRYNLLSNVFKFCVGTGGEKPFPMSQTGEAMPLPDNAECDSFNITTNPNSPGPVAGYLGRWLHKTPPTVGTTNPAQLAGFMGAGTYDPMHDRIILYGGMQPNASHSTAAVTDSSTRTVGSVIYEYTPPSQVGPAASTDQKNGFWQAIPACTEATSTPKGRYGHSLSFDSVNRSLIVVGGYSYGDATLLDGTLLEQTQTYYDGRSFNVPEVWRAIRVDGELPNGIPGVTTDAISAVTPCYYWTKVSTFGNTIDVAAEAPPLTGFAHAASLYIPASGYNTGFYTTHDDSCSGSGPISSTDPAVSKLLAGGAYIDLDRTQLGPTENLLLNLTFIPLDTTNVGPSQNALLSTETAVFKIHLIKTGETGDDIRQKQQPRYLQYAVTEQFPQVAQNLAILTPPNGQVRQEQILIPLGMDQAIDRIRIERYSGNAILIDATVIRMGQK